VLLGTDELAADLGAWAGSPDRRILEVDEDTDAYARGHLPGALAVNWRDDLQDPVRRDFIGPEAFAALMDRIGVGNDTQVVLYGGNSNWFAAYAYWYFRFYGHRAARLLDGGRKTWELEGRPLTTEVPEPVPGHGYRFGGRWRRSGPCAARSWRPSAAATATAQPWWMSVRPTNTPASSWPHCICPRRPPSGRATSRARPTSPGPRRSTPRRARFCPPASCAACIRARA
jgi:hypothetical protein